MDVRKQTGQEDSSYLRKIRKPLVEKQRRERMNHSIDQLKRLIADTIIGQSSPMTRVDKADILDLTVLHLQRLQQRHRSVFMATKSTAYTSGFQACSREVITHLASQKSADPKTIKALSDHLQMALHVHQKCVRNQMSGGHNMSTPVRANEVSNMSSYPLNTPGLSPITNHPNMLSRVYYDGGSVPENYSRLDFTNHDSSVDSCYSNMNVSSLENSDVISESEGIVSIGHNDNIGHVLNETVWRPFDVT